MFYITLLRERWDILSSLSCGCECERQTDGKIQNEKEKKGRGGGMTYAKMCKGCMKKGEILILFSFSI